MFTPRGGSSTQVVLTAVIRVGRKNLPQSSTALALLTTVTFCIRLSSRQCKDSCFQTVPIELKLSSAEVMFALAAVISRYFLGCTVLPLLQLFNNRVLAAQNWRGILG